MFGFGKKKDRELGKGSAGRLADRGTIRSADYRDGTGYLDYGMFRTEYRDGGDLTEVMYLFESEPPISGWEADAALAETFPDGTWQTCMDDRKDPEVRITAYCRTDGIGEDDIPAFVTQWVPYMDEFRHACKDMGFELD